MNFDDINDNHEKNDNDGFDEARRIISEAQRFRPLATCCVHNDNRGATGPTARLDKSSNNNCKFKLKIFVRKKTTFLLLIGCF